MMMVDAVMTVMLDALMIMPYPVRWMMVNDCWMDDGEIQWR